MNGYDSSKVLTVVLGIVGSLLSTALIASVAMLISMGNRLSSIETAINENREVRQRNDQQMDRRIERLESDYYRRQRNGESE